MHTKIEKIAISWSATRLERQTIIINKILDDFVKFKADNELRFCTLHQSEIGENEPVNTIWCTTTRYNEQDIDAIKRDFKDFCEVNNGENCQITKMTCQENTYVVEYSIHRTYILTH